MTIISELCDEDLETYIKNISESFGKTTAEKTQSHFQSLMDLLQGIAQGVQHLHRNGIIHCNIKPSSVLLFNYTKNQYTAKLGRFAYSKKIDKNGIQIFRELETDDGIYAAPECRENNFWSKSSDVFAFGIVMYYALTGGMHPFGPTSDKPKIVDNLKNEKTKPKFVHLRKRQEECTGFEREKWITVIDLIKRMIKLDRKHRLQTEEVLYHPAFYRSQKKLDFLLKVHESVKLYSGANCQKNLGKQINKALQQYNAELMNDDKSGYKAFEIEPEKIFQDYQYFLYGDDGTNGDEGKNPNDKDKRSFWIALKGKGSNKGKCVNIRTLLKHLRNAVAHACDEPPRVPIQFKTDFRGEMVDSYFPEKFLEVFLSDTPQLLVHLYEAYRNYQTLAVDFYPRTRNDR